MIFNFTKIATLVSKLNSVIIGWFCGEKNTPHTNIAERKFQEHRAGGMFGLLVTGDDANWH